MSGKTILLVDDDPEIVKTVRHYLQQEGYDVRVAYNGLDALITVRDHLPDCVVLDVLLPDFDGWEVLQRIRANPQSVKIPIIILTARVEDTDKIRGLDLGADDYVTKPFNPTNCWPASAPGCDAPNRQNRRGRYRWASSSWISIATSSPLRGRRST